MQLKFGGRNSGSCWRTVRLLILLTTISASWCNGIDELFPRSPSMSLQAGDACRTLSDEPGMCTLLMDCRVYLQALRSKTMKYSSIFRCGFVRNDEVICCPLNNVSTANDIIPVTRLPRPQPPATTTTSRPELDWRDHMTTTRPQPIDFADWRVLVDNSILKKPDIVIYELFPQNTQTKITRRPIAARLTTPQSPATSTSRINAAQLWEQLIGPIANITATITIRPHTTSRTVDWVQGQGQSLGTITGIGSQTTLGMIGAQQSSAQLWEQFRRTTLAMNRPTTIQPQNRWPTFRPQTNWPLNRGQSRGSTTTIRPQTAGRTIRPQVNHFQGLPQPTPDTTNMRPSQAFCLQSRALYPSSVDADILKTTQVPVGAFAHIGELIMDDVVECVSSLISERYVLTAASCVADESERPTKVRFGKTAWHPASGTEVEYDIKSVSIHPDYRPKSYYYDIAIVELSSSVLFNHYIQPGCLYPDIEDISATTQLTVIGTSSQDNVMTLFESSTVQLDTCNNSFKSFGVSRSYKYGIAKGHYCVLSEELKTKKCGVDFGAPLQLVNDNGVRTVGIFVFGELCDSPLPAVYNRVAYYLDWIENIVWPKGP